jgi:hypothetical protein
VVEIATPTGVDPEGTIESKAVFDWRSGALARVPE